ncbi:hypothetical protein KUTeg_006446, partial [Tegillarca granosa]
FRSIELNQPIVAVGATQSKNSSNEKCGDTSSESECDDSSSDSEYVVSSSDSEYDDTSSDSEYVVSSSDSEYDDTSSDSEYVVSSLENEDDVSSSENEDDVSSSENKDEMEEVLTRREDQCDDACDDIQDCLNNISTKTIDDDSSFEKEKEILESESESETDDLTVIEKDVADVMDFSESDTPKNLSKKKLHVAVKKNFTKAAQTRHTWSKNEKIALECQFQKNINLEKVPCKLECLNAIKNQSCLARFTWKHIKYAVKNLITSRRRSLKKC